MKSKKAQIAPMCIVQLTHCVKLSVTRKAVVAQFCRHFLKIQTWCKLIKKSKPNAKKDQDHAIWKAVVVNCVVSITLLSLLLRVVMIVWHSVLKPTKAQISAAWKRVIAKTVLLWVFLCVCHPRNWNKLDKMFVPHTGDGVAKKWYHDVFSLTWLQGSFDSFNICSVVSSLL